MTPEESSRRRRRTRVGLLIISMSGLAIAAIAVADQVRVGLLRAGIERPGAAGRAQALAEAARRREVRVADAVCALLDREQDRSVIEAAAYAAMRMRATRAVELIQRRADEGPDDVLRAKLILHAARLANRDVRLIPWLTAGVASSEPWRRAASAVGLLELGQPRGGFILLETTRRLEPDVYAFVKPEFQRIIEPMTQAVGRPVEWPAGRAGRLDDAPWASLRTFWQQHGTAALLNDVLTRLDGNDPKWHQVNRLRHARDRVAVWFK